MKRLDTLCALTFIALTAACAAEPEETAAPEPSTNVGAGGGGGMEMPPEGGSSATGDPPPAPIPTAVGAAYPSSGDARVVLIDATGLRSALYNPSTGTFESADDIDELEGGTPLMDVAAAATVGDATYLFDAVGNVTIYDRDQATFSPAEALPEALDDVPFANVGAAFGAGATLFVFNQGGTRYAAFNTSTETWSQIYDFATEFGNGGAPIANVGAAYTDDGGGYVLFDKSGEKYCIYSSNGVFSDDFDIDELGDGMLTFADE